MRALFFLIVLTHTSFGQNLEKGKLLFEGNKLDEAKKTFAGVNENHKDFAAAQYYLGRIAFAQKDLDSAEEYFEVAIEKNDKVADYYYWYGSTIGSIAQNANSFKQGILAPKIKEAFENTVRLDPNNMDAHWGLIEFYTQAPGFMGGSWEKAEATAKDIAKINSAAGSNALGVVYERQEKFIEAEKQFIKANQQSAEYLFNLSSFYFRQKNYEKALALFEDGSKKDPANMLYVYQIGKVSAISGLQLDKGEQALLKYLSYTPKEREPSHAGANMRLAQIKEKRGLKADAKKLYELALKTDSSLKEAQEGLNRVK